MKKLIILGFMLMLMTSLVAAVDYGTDTLNYWKFNGDLTDETGNQDISDNAGNETYLTGILYQGVYDGGINAIEITSGFTIAGLKTIDYWFYANSTDPNAEVIIESDTDDTFAPYLFRKSGNNWTYEHIIAQDGGAVDCNIVGSIIVTNDSWNHHILTINGTHAIGYFNGVEYVNQACAAIIDDNDTYIYVAGIIDNILLSATNYEPADVTSAYNSGAGVEYNVTPCAENWTQSLGACVSSHQLITYADENSCGTNTTLPGDNGSTQTCGTSSSTNGKTRYVEEQQIPLPEEITAETTTKSNNTTTILVITAAFLGAYLLTTQGLKPRRKRRK
jgi:hypothetical protein